MDDIVKKIAEVLVDMPEDISIEEVKGVNTTIFKLRVAPSDTAKIIGKHGNTVDAIRTLLTAISARNNRKIVLEVME